MPTTVIVDSIQFVKTVDTSKKDKTVESGPLYFDVYLEAGPSDGLAALTPYTARAEVSTKVPGGTGWDFTKDISLDRIFKIKDEPKILRITTEEQADGSSLIHVEALLSAKVCTKKNYSKGDQKKKRVIELPHPPVQIRQQPLSISIMATPVPNDGDILLDFTIPYPAPDQTK